LALRQQEQCEKLDWLDGSMQPMEKKWCHRRLVYSSLLFSVVMAFYGGFLWLWATHYPQYIAIMSALGVDAWHFPFLDTMGPLSWIECHQRGIDVFVANPCDPLNRLFNYSPLILDLPDFGLRVRDTFAIGLSIALLFLTTLPFVFRPATLHALVLACFACLSPSVLFAVERANFDLLEFVLIAAAGLFALRQGAIRFASYAIFITSGLLKFYPFVLLALSVREQPRTFVAIATLSAAALLAFAGYYWSDLQEVAALQPPFIFWGDTFSARQLPFGIANYFHLSSQIGIFITLLMLAVFGYIALRLAPLLQSVVSEPDWQRPGLYFLAIGCLLIVGNFVAGTNVGYRSIMLLFVMPGLLDLRSGDQSNSPNRILTATFWMVLFLLWKDFFRRGVDIIFGQFDPNHTNAFPADWPHLSFFVFRELAWWWVVAVSMAFIGLYLWQSPLARAFMAERWSRVGARA
jgi:hypothetical protein